MEVPTSKRYKYIIVDSRFEDVKLLQQHLKEHPDYNCAGIAKNKDDAINLIVDESPQLVFFDTDLVDGISRTSTFGMIHELCQFLDILPKFIVTSSTKEHAYQAIKNGIFDYILKPLNYYDLKKTLLRFEKIQPETTTICLKSFTEYRFLLINDIVYVQADNNTTDFFLKDGTIITSLKTLKKIESELPNIFIRIHKSYIVNVNYITKIHFSKFQCSLKFTKKLIPFSKSLKSKMDTIKNLWVNGTFDGFQYQIHLE